MKFDVIAQEWLHSKVGLVKDSTLSAYYQQLRSHILPYWKDMDVESFKRMMRSYSSAKSFKKACR